MKKSKFIAIVTIASALLLSGCGKHTHVDANNDFVCDECGEPLEGVESIAIVCDNEVCENELIELKADVKAHGVSKEIIWSVTANDGTAEIVSEDGVYYLKGIKEGSVTLKATAKADASKFASKTITVYSKGFAPGLIDLGFSYSKTFPIKELKEMFGEEATIFAPSEDISGRGLYYIHNAAAGTSAESFMIIYNLNALKALEDPEIYQLGLKLDSEYYGASYLHQVKLSDGNVGFIDNSFTYEFDTSFISNYYSMTWYRVSDFFEDETKTENTDWTEKQKADMMSTLNGQVIPFIQMGASYDYDVNTASKYINFFDYCCDYRISDEYKNVLLTNGFTYSEEQDFYYKQLDDNLYFYIEVFFSEYGNEIYAYIDVEFLKSWPKEKVDEFVSNKLNSEYEIPEFTYGDNSKIYKYESHLDYLQPEFDVITQYATYDDVVSYVNELINENGFSLVGTTEFVTIFLDDPSTCDGKYAIFVLEKGYISLCITINPLYKPDSSFGLFPAEFYFDSCNVKFQIKHSGGYEVKGIYIDDLKYLDEGEALNLELGVEYGLEIVKCKLSSDAVITITSDNEEVATVSQNGLINPVGVGEASIRVTAVDDGTTYSDEIDVVVDYQSIEEEASISDYYDDISSNGTFTFEQSGVTCVISNGTGEDFVFNNEDGTLTLNEGNTISFMAKPNERITKIGFDYAISNEAIITASAGEFVKDAWYATDEENTVTLTLTSGSYTISDLSILTNGNLLPVPSSATVKSLAEELATKLDEWWTGRDIVVDDSIENDIYVSFVWEGGTPSDSGFTIDEAFEYCISYDVIFMFSEEFVSLDYESGVDDDGIEYAMAMYSTTDESFYLFVTLTADTTNDVYSVVCEICGF